MHNKTIELTSPVAQLVMNLPCLLSRILWVRFIHGTNICVLINVFSDPGGVWMYDYEFFIDCTHACGTCKVRGLYTFLVKY